MTNRTITALVGVTFWLAAAALIGLLYAANCLSVL